MTSVSFVLRRAGRLEQLDDGRCAAFKRGFAGK